ncbi:MAG: YhgN family NAAT transporter, partial [Litorivicinus sp.]
METWSVAITLFLIMDPLGNIPVFLSVLKQVAPERRRLVLFRELLIALAIMVTFLFIGPSLLKTLSLSREAVSIGGALVLMIIAVRMIFPSRGGVMGSDEDDGEPLVVPLAVPMIAGPSVLATLVLVTETDPERNVDWMIALGSAWLAVAVIMMGSQVLYRVLGTRGLKAIERLMGMILVSISVQMFLNGIQSFMSHV